MHKLGWYILILLGLITGILIGYFSTQYIFFKIIYELDIVSTSIEILTLLVGIYIAVVIQKNMSNKRVEKDLVIERLKEIKENYYKIDSEIGSNKIMSNVIKGFKITSILISNLEKIFQITCCKKLENDILKLKKNHLSFKMTSTGEKVNKNVFVYSKQVQNKLNSLYERIINDLDNLIIKVNKI